MSKSLNCVDFRDKTFILLKEVASLSDENVEVEVDNSSPDDLEIKLSYEKNNSRFEKNIIVESKYDVDEDNDGEPWYSDIEDAFKEIESFKKVIENI